MKKNRSRLVETMVMAPGAIATGVGRELIGAKLNPTWTNVPVDKKALVMDGVGIAIGGLLEAAGAYFNQPMLSDLGEGVWLPSVAYLSQNLAHETRRKMSKTTTAAVAPTKIMAVGAPAAGRGGYGNGRQTFDTQFADGGFGGNGFGPNAGSISADF
jgi:hypothetical protein